MNNFFTQVFLNHTPKILHSIFENKKISLFTRLFIFIRWLTAPMETLEHQLPKQGKILDIGSGHGLFSLYAALKVDDREMFGVEPDPIKVTEARALASGIKNVQFRTGFFSKEIWGEERFDAIVINDVMYLLPPAEKKHILKEAKKILNPNGVVIVKTNNASFSLGYLLCYLQEFVSVVLLHITFANQRRLYFYTVKEYKEMFEKCGYEVIKSKQLRTSFFHPHHVFVLKVEKED